MSSSTRFAVAVHILTLLALEPGRRLTSEAIALSVNTHPVVIRRTLAYLRKQGLVASHNGADGGWRLTRPAANVTLREVYRSVQPDGELTIHGQPNPRCLVGGNIQGVLEGLFAEAQNALEASLEEQTVADVLEAVQSRAGA